MKKTRVVSGLLSFLMILSLLSAYPAMEYVSNVVDAATTNVAPLAQYYGTGGTNGIGSYGESNWSTYHAGKLNDGVIPTNYAESTTGQNVEIAYPDINNASANVWLYIYFKLDKSYSIASVDVFMNFRNATSRAYPDQITISVGSSETSTTSLGTVSSSSYNTSVKKFTASGSVTGNYVVIGLHVPSGSSVICCSEVNINGVVSTSSGSNIAPSATYRGTAGQNGTGQYSDNGISDAQWQAYHTGRLNDGVIATNYCNIDTNKSVDVLTANETLYFKLDKKYTVTQVKVYTVDRNNVTTRAHPQAVTVSVGTSETSTTALTSGAMPDTTVAVATYSSTGAIQGNYVVIKAKAGIHEGGVQAGSIVFTEVEIYGVPVETTPTTPKLGAPTLSVSNMSNSTVNRYGRYATYTIPTISWGAVANATSYDVYLNGTKVVSDTTATSYTPSSLTPFVMYSKDGNRSCEAVYVVSKASGYTSGTSASVEFLYVSKPKDRNGNEVASADFIIDAGHGGVGNDESGFIGDVGASHGTRYEKDDNLRLALKTGALLEAAGFTVAYTRTTDVFHSVATKAAKAHAGNFRSFLCFHRNSTAGAVGVELYAHSADASSTALKWSIINEMQADALWKMRDVADEKVNDSLGILMGSSVVPTTLLEIGFINTDSDNVLFDTYFNETAQSIARGAMKHLGYSIGYTGFVDSPVSTAVSGGAVSFNATAGNYGSSASLGVAGWLLNSYGISKYQYSTDGSTWKDANAYDRSGELGAYTSFANKSNAGYSATISTDGWTPGTYNVQLRAVSNWETTTKYNQLLPIANISLTVSDTVPSYTVRFLVDGVAISTQTVKLGGSATAPANPTKVGHTFSKWDAAFTNVQGNLDVNAVFTPINYTVRFLVDGEVFNEQSVPYGTAAADPGIPTKEGHTFSNWDTSFTTITGTTDINAVFTPISYTVRFLVDGEVFNEQSVPYGTAAADPGVPTKEGHTFSNWDTNFEVITGDKDINAVFTPISYTVRFLVDGEVFDEQSVPYGTAAADPGVPTKEGHTFSNWDTSFTVISGATDINAIFTPINYTVRFLVDGEVFDEQSVPYGTAAADPGVPAKVGHTFSNWDASFSTITDSIDINAVFTPISYTVRFLVDGEVFDEQSVPYGTAAADPGVPTKVGHTFSNWDASYEVVTAAVDINAVFTINTYKVTFCADGVVISEQDVKYGYPAEAPSNIPAKPGYKANGWDTSFDKIIGITNVNVVYEYDASQWFTVEFVIPENATTDDVINFGPFVTGTKWDDVQITVPNVIGVGLYAFKGWDREIPETITENVVFNAIVVAEGNATVIFGCDDGGVIYHVEDGSIVVGGYSVIVPSGTLSSELEMPVVLCNVGYTFDGWYVDGIKLDNDTIIDKDIALIAKFKSSLVSFGDYTVEDSDGMTKNVTISVNSSINLETCYMYIFEQKTDGTTTVTISDLNAVATSVEGEYTVSVAIIDGSTSELDVFVTEDIIDFSSNWNALASIIGISVLA